MTEVRVPLVQDDGEDAAAIQEAVERHPGTSFTVRRVDQLRRAIEFLAAPRPTSPSWTCSCRTAAGGIIPFRRRRAAERPVR
jgi:hypothetical protein